MAKYYKKHFKRNSQIPETEQERIWTSHKKWWEPCCPQSRAESRWALGTQHKDPSTSPVQTQLSSPMLPSHTPFCVPFLRTQGICIHDYSAAQLQQKNQSQPCAACWLCCISMWHENFELELIQAKPLFGPPQSLLVKAQSKQLKQPWWM